MFSIFHSWNIICPPALYWLICLTEKVQLFFSGSLGIANEWSSWQFTKEHRNRIQTYQLSIFHFRTKKTNNPIHVKWSVLCLKVSRHPKVLCAAMTEHFLVHRILQNLLNPKSLFCIVSMFLLWKIALADVLQQTACDSVGTKGKVM